MTHDLPNLQDLAHEGRTSAESRLRPVLGQGGVEHDAGAFVRSAQGGTGGDCGGAEGVAAEARQGHSYDHGGLTVIAMESGTNVLVLPHRNGRPGLSYHVDAKELVALPMAYFGGRIP